MGTADPLLLFDDLDMACALSPADLWRRVIQDLRVGAGPVLDGSWSAGYTPTPLVAAALAVHDVTLVVARQTRRTTNEGRRTGYGWSLRSVRGDGRAGTVESVPGHGDLAGWTVEAGTLVRAVRADVLAWCAWSLELWTSTPGSGDGPAWPRDTGGGAVTAGDADTA